MFLNQVTVLGNLTQVPEIRQLPSGAQVANFTLATTRKYKNKDENWEEETEFHKCVTFDKYQIQTLEKYGVGDKFILTGRLKTSSWDAQDGSKRYKTEIFAESVKFVSHPKGKGGEGFDVKEYEETPINQNNVPKAPRATYDNGEIPIEDIPF